MSKIKHLTNPLVRALINSESAETIEEAIGLISDMQVRVELHGEDPEEVLQDYNLEPDYVFDLLYFKS